jgi:hypothetical protein
LQMEKFRLTSNGYVYKQGDKPRQSPKGLPSINFIGKPTKTSQLRNGVSLPELNASSSVHKFPVSRKQATLARLDSRDDINVKKNSTKKTQELQRQRSKSHDPETRKTKIKIKGNLPTLKNTNSENIFNGNAILWKHQIPVLVSFFLHDDFDCIEVITYDLRNNVELERLYVIASRIYSIIESYPEIAAVYSNNIAKSEAIINARINCTIDYLMSHLGSEKIAFMPVVPTLRRYNGIVQLCCIYCLSHLYVVEKTKRRDALTIPKPLWLVAGQVDPVCQIIGVLLGKNVVHTAATMNVVKLRWKWAIKKVMGMNKARYNITYAWRRLDLIMTNPTFSVVTRLCRATVSTNLLINMKRGDSLEDMISTVQSGDEGDDSDGASFLSDSEVDQDDSSKARSEAP